MNDNIQKSFERNLSFREATMDDARLLWEWANDLSVREQSFNTEPIEWESHIIWLQKRMNSSDTQFYLLLENKEPVGQIRYDREEDGISAEIGFSVAKEHRGKRFGIELLNLTRNRALKDLNCKQITALVIKGNEASHKAFLRAGFEEAGVITKNGKTSHKFVWKPEEN
jgi:UDP-2,4-diacetamido-2,4,6-trideoxy-beta-L-altropyranose hydrolase